MLADYSAKTATEQGSRLLLNVVVQEAIAEVMQERSERAKVTADQVVAEFVKMGFVNMMDYMRIGENGDPYVDMSALTTSSAPYSDRLGMARMLSNAVISEAIGLQVPASVVDKC